MASPREKIFASAPAMPTSRNSTTMAVEIRSSSGSSLLIVDFLMRIGRMTAARPIKRRMLMMLLPITLPISMSVLPLTRALIETASSGAPVPKATMVRPISCLETLKCDATDDDPDTNQSAPLIRKMKPTIRRMICIIDSMFVLLCYGLYYITLWKIVKLILLLDLRDILL